MNQPLVTVVTVTFNLVKGGRSDAFRRAADSIYRQTYSNIEHIIIDGASDDGTLALFKEYVDAGKMTVFSEPDSGIYNAMNKGLARANGKYIIYLNSDDYWHNPCGIEQSVHMLELAQADFSVAPFTLQKENGSIAGISTPSPASFFSIMPCCHQTMLARVDKLRSVGGFDESFRIAADYNLTTRLLLRGAHPVITPCNFVTFREGGISNRPEMVALHDEERRRIFHMNYDAIIGEKRAAKLLKGEADADLLLALSYIVHPSVAQHLSGMVLHYNAGRYLTTSGGAIRRNSLSSTTKITGLFNIPLLEITATPAQTRYKALGFIPLCASSIEPLSHSSHAHCLSILGIPILRSIYTEQTCRKILFGCITIYKKRVI
ncbi:MAG: glycosyltransferase family 2 protein [bacterium]|nr:glycosyltransferase family 2 protein [bacterium]